MKRKINLSDKESIEINYWQRDHPEHPRQFTKENFLNKIQEAKHLNYKLHKYQQFLKGKSHILEIGAGQGWASTFMKRYFLPNAHFTVTDISPHAIASLTYWEDLFKVRIDKSFASKSYLINVPDATFDLIFCYSAAHHFVQHQETIAELSRLLKKNGHIIYLYEPTTGRFWYPLYYWYVNKVPHVTPEDVLVPREITRYAEKAGLEVEVVYDAHQTIQRSVRIALYFRLLKWLPFLQRYLPASSDFIFTKK